MNLNHISIFSGVTTVDESCWKARPNPGQFVAKRLGCCKRTWHDLLIWTPKSLVSAAEKRYPNKHIKYSFLKVAKTSFLEFSLQVAAFGSHEPSSSSCSHPSRWDMPIFDPFVRTEHMVPAHVPPFSPGHLAYNLPSETAGTETSTVRSCSHGGIS